MNPYEILNIPLYSSIEDVKKTYKKIAIMSHPDKLNNISDMNEKNKKIKYFIDATNAYNMIVKTGNNDNNNDYNYEWDSNMNTNDWEKTFDDIMNSNLFKSFITNVFNNFKSKTKKHNINVDIKFSDYFNNQKKKLRIFLKNVKEPVYINLNCKNYPLHIINYFDDNDYEHEISINMNLINDLAINKGFYFKEQEEEQKEQKEQGKMNIYYDMEIDTHDYIIGTNKQLDFFNNEIIDINIPPFSSEIIINDKGINNGDLIINFIYMPTINKKNWYILEDCDKNNMIRILKKIKNI